MSRRLGLAAVALVFLLAGCLEEKTKVSLNSDGSGKLHVHQKLGKQLSSFALMGDEEDKAAGAKKSLVQELAKYDGIVAWTDLKASVEDERVVVDATGWFEDANAVAKVQKDGKEHWSYKKTGSEAAFEWLPATDKKKAEKKPLDEKVPSEQERKMVSSVLAELDVSRTIEMPGAVTKAEGSKVEGKAATWGIKGPDVQKVMDEVFTKITDAKAKVEKKELTEDQANEQLTGDYEKLQAKMSPTFKVVSKVDESDAAAWKKDLEAAKKAWDESPDRKAVDEKVKARSEEPFAAPK